MDRNKLKVLEEIEYEGVVCCGNCISRNFSQSSDFGTCTQFTYEHLKHSDKKRSLSIYRYGKCFNHIKDDSNKEAQMFLSYLE